MQSTTHCPNTSEMLLVTNYKWNSLNFDQAKTWKVSCWNPLNTMNSGEKVQVINSTIVFLGIPLWQFMITMLRFCYWEG